jgi:hypothetical protein
MKHLRILAAIAIAPASVLAVAPMAFAQAATPTSNPEALALGKQIVDVAYPPATRQVILEKLMQTMLDQMKAGMPLDKISDPGLRQILLNYLADIPNLLRPTMTTFVPKQMDAIAQAYARMFTPAELKDIASFASTPSGKAFLQRNTEVMSDPAVAAVNTECFRELQAINARTAPALSQKVEAYVKAHPDAAKGLTPPGG